MQRLLNSIRIVCLMVLTSEMHLQCTADHYSHSSCLKWCIKCYKMKLFKYEPPCSQSHQGFSLITEWLKISSWKVLVLPCNFLNLTTTRSVKWCSWIVPRPHLTNWWENTVIGWSYHHLYKRFAAMLEEIRFDLNDRLCDAADLKQASGNMKMPKPLLKFLSYL